jgi:hypothetical protein
VVKNNPSIRGQSRTMIRPTCAGRPCYTSSSESGAPHPIDNLHFQNSTDGRSLHTSRPAWLSLGVPTAKASSAGMIWQRWETRAGQHFVEFQATGTKGDSTATSEFWNRPHIMCDDPAGPDSATRKFLALSSEDRRAAAFGRLGGRGLSLDHLRGVS